MPENDDVSGDMNSRKMRLDSMEQSVRQRVRLAQAALDGNFLSNATGVKVTLPLEVAATSGGIETSSNEYQDRTIGNFA